MDQTASQYFGEMVEEYDSLLERAVPRYKEMLERMLVYAPERATRILELGCGTGNLTRHVAGRYPEAELTLVDGSEEMLACAASRLDGRPVTRVVARFEELDLPAASFDLVISSMALHHVVDYAALFRDLHRLVAPGGRLVYQDQMAGRTERNSAINWGAMADFWRLPGHLSPEECRSLEEHARDHDHYRPILDLVRAIEDAGFVETDVVWRNWMWGMVTARRAVTP